MSLIIFDVKCAECGKTWEVIQDRSRQECTCDCGGIAKRIFTVRGPNCFNEDAPWIRSILDVVDKESGDPATVEFLKRPTRTNYKNWMKSQGLRHLEPGEKPKKPPPPDIDSLTRKLVERHRERNKLTIY